WACKLVGPRIRADASSSIAAIEVAESCTDVGWICTAPFVSITSLFGSEVVDSELKYPWRPSICGATPSVNAEPRTPAVSIPKKLFHFEFVFSLLDRKSTRLNSSHVKISYAVFCLKKKKKR